MAALEVLHLDVGSVASGRRFCVWHRPATARPRASVVLVPPFAEEMNKSRRMVATAGRALAAAGFSVLRLDPLGCGDSSGEFEDATWEHWIEDVVQAAAWLRARDDAPLWLWGVRAGALLACAAAERLDGPVPLLMWQPAPQGKSILQAFMRLRLASADKSGLGGKAEIEQMRADWLSGLVVEIAGYAIAPALAAGLERATLTAPQNLSRAVWLEVSNRPEPALLPASASLVEAWRDRGINVHTQIVPGPPFWQTVEIEDAPALVDATVTCLMEATA